MPAREKDKRRIPLPAEAAPRALAPHDKEDPAARPRSILLTRSAFIGPMPPPDLIAAYEEIHPGAAAFFFTSTERQALHRQALEAKVIHASVQNERVGMWLGFVLALVMTLCGTFLIHEGKDPQGLAIVAATLATLCGVFVYSRRRGRNAARGAEEDGAGGRVREHRAEDDEIRVIVDHEVEDDDAYR